ncbi:hypothetical protein, partial [Nocardioides sp.]|uniref:hypothetical protein n=1 Tax=Nocardioides sp. TaxID=35761 RepID=UPI0031FECD5D|nr:hypothetical protein [Nocardioides sp.]
MPLRLRALSSVLASLLIASLATVFVPSPSIADEGVNDVGLTGFSDIVVDEPHGHVFISQPSGSLVVVDLDGD